MSSATSPGQSTPAVLTTGPDPGGPRSAAEAEGARRTVWETVRAGIGAALGVLPHVMHHIGLLAGAALLTGALGNSVLYAVGLLLSIPLLRRLRARFRSWWAPAIGVAVFTAAFSVSAFVIGPAISGAGDGAPAQAPTPTVTTTDAHTGHH